MIENLPAMQETWFDPWFGMIPRRRKCIPTPEFMPGEFHGQRSLVGYNPRGHKESDTTEQLTHLHFIDSFTGICSRTEQSRPATRLCPPRQHEH